MNTPLRSLLRLAYPGHFLGLLLAWSCAAQSVCPPPPGLVGWWRGEGNALDSAGTNHGTMQGGGSYAAGAVGQAFSFDGVNDFVLVPDSASLDLAGGLTMEMWFKANGWIAGDALFDKRTFSSCNYGFIVSTDNGLQLYYDDPNVFGGDHPGNQFEIAAHFPLPTINVWHHLAGSFHQANPTQIEVRMYLDGALIESRLFNGNLANTVNNAPVSIGSARGGAGEFYWGLIDEVSLYNRALTLDEIAAIHAAGPAGKCPTNAPSQPPLIISQPQSLTVFEGAPASFTVTASGTPPLRYTWRFNGGALTGETNSTLSIVSTQLGQAGNYDMIVANAHGAVTSAVAVLTVNPLPSCRTAPAGLVAWWRGEGNAMDSVGSNHGTMQGGGSYAPGAVGQAFAFDGVNDFVLVPDSASLDLIGGLTMELWFKANDWVGGNALIDKRTFGDCNYGLFVSTDFGVQLYYDDPSVFGGDHPGNQFEIAAHFPVPTINVWHHLAGSFRQADPAHIEVRMYLDGALVESRLFNGNLANTVNGAPVAIGAARGGAGEFFGGLIDEVSLYNRALTLAEIAAIHAAGPAGKCPTNIPPSPPIIVLPPQSLTVYEGAPASFTVTASGALPLAYQWRFNGGALGGQTQPILSIASAQLAQAGAYDVVVSNPHGTVTSAVATLAVIPLPPCPAVPPGLVSWWRGEGNALDSAGSNHGTMQGGGTYAPGVDGQAFAFDGVNDFVLVPDSPSLDLTGGLTMELWFKANDWVLGDSLFDKRTFTDCNYGLFVSRDYGVQLFYNDPNVFGGDHPGNLHEIAAHFPLPSIQAWHHIVGTLRQADPTHIDVRMYIDGTLVESRLFSGNLANTVNGAPVAIGAARGGAGEFFGGLIDEVRLYNRALTPAEVLCVYTTRPGNGCANTDTIAGIVALVNNSSLPSNRRHPLLVSLDAAQASLDRGKPDTAINQLEAFKNKVRAQVERLDAALAACLIQAADATIGRLRQPAPPVAARGANVRHPAEFTKDGAIKLQLKGIPLRNHVIEASSDLITWTPIATVKADGLGMVTFKEQASLPGRFYRVVPPRSAVRPHAVTVPARSAGAP